MADAATTREREALAVQLRKAGISYDQIAAEVGYANRGTAWKAVQRALRRVLVEEVVELRALELLRLDEMLMGLYKDARKGDVKAIDRVLAIARQRARYVPGLEESDQLQVTGAGGIPLTVELVMPEPDTTTPPVPEAALEAKS